jgi:hypothetical protein
MRMPVLALAFVLALSSGAAAERIELSDTLSSASVAGPGFRVSLRMETRQVEGADARVPVMRISEGGEVMLEAVGEASGFDFPYGSVDLVEIDPTNDVPEAVFSSFTGGAHCCTSVKVADHGPDGRWTLVDLGFWDGDGGSTEDLDGDGVAEFSSRDNSFLYAFDCYACSEAPLQIFTIENAVARDVTADPRYLDAHRRWLAEMEARIAETGGEKSPGIWAGWIAAKARVGEGAEAWRRFLSEYRPAADDPGVMVCAVQAEECPEDQWITLPLVEALGKFLRDGGFVID